MKQLEEEFGMDRAIEIETDDEDDEAERVCHDNEDDNESDITGLSRVPSYDLMDPDPAPSWPQSYRQSMDMYTSVTPSVSFIRGSSFLVQADKRSQAPDIESPLTKPFLSATNSDREIVPTSIPPIKLSSVSVFGASISELPPPLQQCSYAQSLLNATNALCGIGILSTPYALKEGGWFGLLLLFMFGIIACYTGILLKRCLESSSQLQTYPDIGQAAFGLGGRICIAVILYIELYSSCVEFLIMMSDNLSATFPNAQVHIAGIHLDSYQICAIVATLVILPTVWLRNLSLLSYVSIGGVVTLALVVLCLLWVGVVSDIGFNPSGKALNFTHLPITIGIYSFCYGGHSVFPNIYSSMENPSQFPSVLAISFGISHVWRSHESSVHTKPSHQINCFQDCGMGCGGSPSNKVRLVNDTGGTGPGGAAARGSACFQHRAYTNQNDFGSLHLDRCIDSPLLRIHDGTYRLLPYYANVSSLTLCLLHENTEREIN
ncbi:amino acid transporter AVT1D-like isoform X2 [Salvia miltiorrhiza]|uniref:amino acid transporter AVT1D-like isoform X2 n=1 Tax=Salvia miltiorrhiza TaxID=226208 RepID=UPI0025AC6453|nr:amino acid transporter AVT1D-like isoform X2 [Salvia miltiorrhiza]